MEDQGAGELTMNEPGYAKPIKIVEKRKPGWRLIYVNHQLVVALRLWNGMWVEDTRLWLNSPPEET